MKKFLATLAAVSLNAFACQPLSGELELEKNQRNIQRERELTHTLALEADGIFLAAVTATDELEETALLRVTEVLKGNVAESQLATEIQGDRGLVISCESADSFENVYFHEGRSYIIYSKGGRFLRAGWVERVETQISLEEEMKIVSNAVAPN